MAQKSMLVLISGVSGAGKDTVKKQLIERIEDVVSMPAYTSRNQRPGDVPNETYVFTTDEEFEKMIENGDFYEYSKHHNHYYGTSKKYLQEKIKSGKIIVKDMDVNGTENLIKLLKNDIKIITVFLKVPKEELKRRLLERIDKPTTEEIELRLSRFEYEESKIGLYDYVIKNNNLEKTVQLMIKIIEQELIAENLEF